MSLQLALLIIVSAGAGALAVSKWYAFACADLDRLSSQEHWAGRFAEGSRRLLSDPRVPAEFLTMLSGLNSQKLDRNSCIALYAGYTRLAQGQRLSERPETEPVAFWGDDIKFHELVSATLFAGIMMISYSDLRWGEKARGAMARLYHGEARVTELVSAAAHQVNRRDHDLPTGLVAA